jgi:integrase
MGFNMARTVRNLLERDGRFYARVVVPTKLRPCLEGKTELRTPLGADRRAAIKALPNAIVAIQVKLHAAERAAAAAGDMPHVVARFPMTAEHIALRSYQHRLDQDENARNSNPGYSQLLIDDGYIAQLRDAISGTLDDGDLAKLVGRRIDRFRELGHTDAQLGTPEWRHLARMLCRSELEALTRLYERDEGNFSGNINDPAIAQAASEPAPEICIVEQVSLMGLFDDYVAAKKAVGKGDGAAKRWAPVFKNLCTFLGHDDARRLKKQDLKDWRNEAIKTRSAKTVSDVWLASVRTVMNWAVREDRIMTNVAQDVRQELQKKSVTRERGFTDTEAAIVLAAAWSYARPEKEHEVTALAKKWVPWLSAFTGARVTELTQLRKQDIRQEGKHWVIRITPEAGTVKTGGYRDVPLHPQLVELGFPDLVMAAPGGPLFYRTASGNGTLSGARTVSGRISAWLGKLEIIPKGVSPNHGWRHRFKTVGRELGSSDRVLDAICGHVGKTAGDNYGDVTLNAKARVIESFPNYAIDI